MPNYTWTWAWASVVQAGNTGRKWENADPGCLTWLGSSNTPTSLLKCIRALPDVCWPWLSCLDVLLLAWWVWRYLGLAWHIWMHAEVFELVCSLAPSAQGLRSPSFSLPLSPFLSLCLSQIPTHFHFLSLPLWLFIPLLDYAYPLRGCQMGLSLRCWYSKNLRHALMSTHACTHIHTLMHTHFPLLYY